MALQDNVMNRGTSNIIIDPDVSSEIWTKARESSAVMQLARQIALPGNGLKVQTIEGKPEAQWVNELAEKPVTKATLGSKEMSGYTMALIIPFSNQFRRDKNALFDAIIEETPGALAEKFDRTVFTGADVPGENFDTFAGVSAVSVKEKLWDGLVTADATVAAAGGTLDGWVISPKMKSKLLTATDGLGRTLFIDNMTGSNSVPEVLGQPTYVRKSVYQAAVAASQGVDASPEVIGYAGDWSSARYGIVEPISMSISDQASLKIGDETVNLWQRNMFAVRFEFEVGFRFQWPEQFVKLTCDGAE